MVEETQQIQRICYLLEQYRVLLNHHDHTLLRFPNENTYDFSLGVLFNPDSKVGFERAPYSQYVCFTQAF